MYHDLQNDTTQIYGGYRHYSVAQENAAANDLLEEREQLLQLGFAWAATVFAEFKGLGVADGFGALRAVPLLETPHH